MSLGSLQILETEKQWSLLILLFLQIGASFCVSFIRALLVGVYRGSSHLNYSHHVW